MTPVDRVMSTLWLEEPDRVPIGELDIHDTIVSKYTGLSVSQAGQTGVAPSSRTLEERERLVRRKIDALAAFVEKLGLDIFPVGETTPAGYKPIMIDPRSWIDEWAAKWSYRDTPYGAEPWYLSGALDDLAKTESFEPPDPLAEGRTDAVEYAVRKLKGSRAIIGTVPGPKLPYLARGLDRYLADLFMRPSLARRLMDLATSYNVELAKAIIDAGVDVICISGDLAYRDGPLMRVKDFREVFAPHIKTITELVHRKGLPVIKHSDGNLNPILVDLVETGVDAIHSLEPIAGMNVKDVKDRFGNRICLLGNIDCTYTLCEKQTSEVEAEVRACIADGATGGGLILSSSNCFHKACRIENIEAMVISGRAYGRYPI